MDLSYCHGLTRKVWSTTYVFFLSVALLTTRPPLSSISPLFRRGTHFQNKESFQNQGLVQPCCLILVVGLRWTRICSSAYTSGILYLLSNDVVPIRSISPITWVILFYFLAPEDEAKNLCYFLFSDYFSRTVYLILLLCDTYSLIFRPPYLR